MTLAGFTRPTSGSVTFADREVTRLPPHKRNIGIVFQNYALFPHMSVGANLAYPLRLRELGRAAIEAKVRGVLALVKLAGMADRQIDSLSGGQRQRVALARAIVFEPRILLMDEPLSALDKNLREQMQFEIRNVHRQLGITTIYVTHDQREAMTMADQITVLNEGRVEQVGTPREIYERPATRFVAEFMGDATLIRVEISNGSVLHGGRPIRVAERPDLRDRSAYVVLRPERLSVLAQPADPERVNVFRGRVEDAIYQGDSVLTSLRLDGGEVISVRLSGGTGHGLLPRPGDKISVALQVSDTILVPERAGRAA